MHESDEISFSIPHGLKPLVFGDKCFLCGNSVINGHSPEPDPSSASSLYLNQSSAWKSCSLEVNQLLRAFSRSSLTSKDEMALELRMGRSN